MYWEVIGNHIHVFRESGKLVKFAPWSPLVGQYGFWLSSPLILRFTPQPLRAGGVLFSPMMSGCTDSQRAGGGKKFVRAVSKKP